MSHHIPLLKETSALLVSTAVHNAAVLAQRARTAAAAPRSAAAGPSAVLQLAFFGTATVNS